MEASVTCETDHDFALVLTGVNELTSEMEDALFEAGCDDATISVRQGQVFLMLTRKAASRNEAIWSALQDVGKANLSATVECSP